MHMCRFFLLLVCRSLRWVAVVSAGVFGLTDVVQAGLFSAGGRSIEAITFAASPGRFYVPLEEAGMVLHWSVKQKEGAKDLVLNKVAHPRRNLRQLVDGTVLVAIRDLEGSGAVVERDGKDVPTKVGKGRRRFDVVMGAKRAEVNLELQRLRAWQGERLVLDSRVSSGKSGRTPAGSFKAGPYKARMHYSKRYNNAKMPWSVQINGHIFIHGF